MSVALRKRNAEHGRRMFGPTIALPEHLPDMVPRCIPSFPCALGAERQASPAAESGSDAGADAGGSQVQRFVRRCPAALPKSGHATFVHWQPKYTSNIDVSGISSV